MKSFLMFLSLICSCSCCADYSPFLNGAKASVKVVVADENGRVVSNANVRVAFLVEPAKEETVKGSSDNDGTFNAFSSLCIGRYTISVIKDGYYDTFVKRSISAQDVNSVVRSRKWTEGEKVEKVTLKRIHKPVKMERISIVNGRFPATNEVLKLDLQSLQWCAPYGKGVHDDMHIVYKAESSSDVWLEFSRSLEISFPNAADGFYKAKLDGSGSCLRYDYTAETDRSYNKKLHFSFGRTEKAITNNVSLADDEYLICRVRSKTNEVGKVVSAHYGVIGERIRYIMGFDISSIFNPTVNDTNLESDWVYKKMMRGKSRRRGRLVK